jgi:predicted permease
MNDLAADIRYAIRQFWSSPVFTATVLVTIALGIGGTTAIFTLIDAVMLRSLPVADPARLYRIGEGDNCCVQGSPQERWGMYSFRFYEQLKGATPEFEQLAAFQAGGSRFSVRREGSEAKPLGSEFVTGNYFSTLGVGAFGGRLLTPDDDRRAAAPVVVLSYHLWQGVYGSDPSVVGSTLVIEGHAFTVIGITPPAFFGDALRGDPPDLWLPMQHEPLLDGGSGLLDAPFSAWLRVIGRLRPGASVEGMSPRLTGLLRQWMQSGADYPANWMPEITRNLPKQVINVIPAGGGIGLMKEQYGRNLQILLAVCGLVLLIACANVANLMLARSVARRSYTAVRLALGASRRQLVKQALVESILLAFAGAGAGLLVAVGTARLLLALAFTNTRFLPISTRPSPTVLLFASGLAVLTGILFGAAPAWFATRANPIDALRGSGRGTTDRSHMARQALLVVQATLCIVLVAGATLLARSLSALEHQDFGFQAPGRVLVSINRPPATYTQPMLAALYRTIEARLSRVPGITGTGLALYNPLTSNWGEGVLVAGHPPPAPGQDVSASWDRVSANYLQNLGMRTVRGRHFTEADNETSAPVAVVNEAFVKRFFKSDEDPLDRHFGLDLPENVNTFRIVGVVGDAKFAGFQLDRPARPMFYVPLAQNIEYPSPMMQRLELASHFISGIMLVTEMPPGTLEPLVTKALAEVDPNLTVAWVRTLQQQIDLSFNQQRAVASLAALFGVVALGLAAVGLYGMTAYTVVQRTNEIGIRMALGADRFKVVNLVLGGAFRRVVAGLILGLPLAVGAGKLLSAELHNVSFWDPLALAVATGSLATCALVAAVIPANRAASISPMSALRSE